jgi:TonB family protein
MPFAPSTSSTTISAREELRSKLRAIASQQGIALVSRRDQWDTCQRLLVDSRGEAAREIHAVLAALRCGIVADLVAWRADGATAVERELTRRLVDRAGLEPALAYWAIESWAHAYRIPLSGDAPTASDIQEMITPRGRDIVIRTRHIVLAGAFAGLAVAATVVSGGLSSFRNASADSTSAAPSTPRRVPQQMASRTRRNGGATSARNRARDTARVAERPRSEQASLGDVVARMPAPARNDPAPIAARRPSPSEDASGIRGAFAMEPPRTSAAVEVAVTPKLSDVRDVPPPTPLPTRGANPAAVQAGAPSETNDCREWRPRLRRNVEAAIPRSLQERGIMNGRVLLRFSVDADGVPDAGTARVVESSTSALVPAALEALEQLRYEPAPDGGCGRVVVERTIRFW